LFIYFGLRLLKDAYDADGSGPSEELQEVEEELIKKKDSDHVSSDDVEVASSNNTDHADIEHQHHDDHPSSALVRGGKDTSSKTSANFKIFSQAFTLTFLAEWGDRSQIATIALAASKNPLGVVVGGLIGHAFCTGLAVVGGRLLAARISEKHVALVGGILFVFFGIHGYLVGPED
jgi:Ca2+/H+ antiporter, TMEM165/GDT1 family